MRNLRPHSEGDGKPGSSLRHLGSELPLSSPWAPSAHGRDEAGIQVVDPHVTSGPDESHVGIWWQSAGVCHLTVGLWACFLICTWELLKCVCVIGLGT